MLRKGVQGVTKKGPEPLLRGNEQLLEQDTWPATRGGHKVVFMMGGSALGRIKGRGERGGFQYVTC